MTIMGYEPNREGSRATIATFRMGSRRSSAGGFRGKVPRMDYTSSSRRAGSRTGSPTPAPYRAFRRRRRRSGGSLPG